MTKEAGSFDPEVVLQGYEPDEFTVDQWKMLRWCTSKEACNSYIERLPGTVNEVIIPVIKRIKASMTADASVITTPFEQKCYDCVVGFEQAMTEEGKRRYIATRTRLSAKGRGWRGAIENIVARDHRQQEPSGFEGLLKISRLDASYEVFVLRNENQFSEKSVKSAKERLKQAGYTAAL